MVVAVALALIDKLRVVPRQKDEWDVEVLHI